MGRVRILFDRIDIVFSDGTTYSPQPPVKVNATMSVAQITTIIKKMIRSAFYKVDAKKVPELRRLYGSSAYYAGRVHRFLNRGSKRAAPRPRPAARRRTTRRTTRRTRRTTRRRTRRTRRRTRTKTVSVTSGWITSALTDAGRGDYRSRRAASKTHSGRLFVKRYLAKSAQRGVARTAQQKALTVAIFNSLYKTSPWFRLLLSSLAAQQHATKKSFPEFVTLQQFVSAKKDLAKQGTTKTLQAADMYIRYFLYNFIANHKKYGRLRSEMNQLPDAKTKIRYLRSLSNALAMAIKAKRVKDITRYFSLLKLQLAGPMDADTLTSSILYMRRYTLEHPKRGRGRTQAGIILWKAPSVIALPRSRRTAPSRATKTPVIGIIGDSMTAGGRYARTLQTLLKAKYRGTRVGHYGVVGQSILQIEGRFRRQILNNRMGFNTVIIQGGINKINLISLKRAQAAFSRMIKAAKARGMKVIILGITPWADYSGSNQKAQVRTQMMNTFLKNQAKADGSVVFVDMKPLGERGPRGWRLKAQYAGSDKLHPNQAGRDFMAHLIAKAVYGVIPKAASAKVTLQRWAARHWKNLETELFKAVKANSATEVIKLSKKLPAGRSSIEAALRLLKRDDIKRAVDMVFNQLIKSDKEFVAYCRRRRRSKNIIGPAVKMSPSTSARDRRLIVTSIKRFINHKASQRGDLAAKLKGDMRKLLIHTFKGRRSKIYESPTEDIKFLAAMAVYRWRMANPNAKIGAWDKRLGAVPVRKRTLPRRKSPPATTPRKSPTTIKRRRTINI